MKFTTITSGPFAETRKAMDDFCHNLYLSYAMNEVAAQLAQIEAEYHLALLCADDDLAEQKKLQLKACQSSLTLTAYMFDEVDEIST